MRRQKKSSSFETRSFFVFLSGRWFIVCIAGLLTLAAVAGITTLVSAAPTTTGESASSGHHYWNLPYTAFYQKRLVDTDSRAFYIGDSIVLPNALKLQVVKIQRNWQPPAAVSASYGREPDGDNPAGREVVLVWFSATNIGTSSIGFADTLFTLQVPGELEQRVAHISSLLPFSYGSYGVSPWLLPGQSKLTFVPFLVKPGVILSSFQYYIPPAHSEIIQGKGTLTRISILLQPPTSRVPTSFIFQPGKTMIVG